MKSLTTTTQKYLESCISKQMLFSSIPRDTETVTINFVWGWWKSAGNQSWASSLCSSEHPTASAGCPALCPHLAARGTPSPKVLTTVRFYTVESNTHFHHYLLSVNSKQWLFKLLAYACIYKRWAKKLKGNRVLMSESWELVGFLA